MAKLRVVELSEVVGKLPDISAFDPAGSVCREGDLFISALGFEPRCLTIPEQMVKSGWRFEVSVEMLYSEAEQVGYQGKALEKNLKKLSSSLITLKVDDVDVGAKLARIIDDRSKGRSGRRPLVLVDVSVFANRVLLTLMKTLIESDIRLQVLYSEASDYYPTEDQYNRDPDVWKRDNILGLERGVGDVRISEEYPGHDFTPLPDTVILFPTFKRERSYSVIGEVDPALLDDPGENLVWIVGRPHLETNAWRSRAVREINDIGPQSLSYDVSTFNYKETLEILSKLYERYSGHSRVSLSPLGSKLQAIGTSLFCFMHPDVRVMFAVPKEYNVTEYSRGVGAVWQIDFDQTVDLRAILNRAGQLEVVFD